ncbi:MAG: four helix bundle protein [candidate division WOR-3 bacterium]|nr:four helix bundle protein [candidate division WOR-3 bacterium]
MIKDYKDLAVWQQALQVASEIVDFIDLLPPGPATELIGKQIIRSSTSVCANIAEGHSSGSSKEFNRILKIAYREAKETDNWLQVIKKVKRYDKPVIINTVNKLESDNLAVIKMLSALRKKIYEALTQE